MRRPESLWPSFCGKAGAGKAGGDAADVGQAGQSSELRRVGRQTSWRTMASKRTEAGMVHHHHRLLRGGKGSEVG